MNLTIRFDGVLYIINDQQQYWLNSHSKPILFNVCICDSFQASKVFVDLNSSITLRSWCPSGRYYALPSPPPTYSCLEDPQRVGR
mmetsp:Transcript_18971/g.26133  ORF Transcript_18971/g.26133 Transcript_18971/m.26133 type:complete len:85 (-) Transcript_18971:431-685(-)